jgi:hypothetical protein
MARMAIVEFIEGWFYSSWRRHSSIGNLRPAKFEHRWHIRATSSHRS